MPRRKALEKAEAEAQHVRYERREVLNSKEIVALRGSMLILKERGDLPVMALLSQVYDQPNVVAIDLHINDRSLLAIRQVNKVIEQRVRGLIRVAAEKPSQVHIRIVAVFG